MNKILIGIGGVITLVIIIVVMGFFSFVKIEGSEIGVVQDWGGVKEQSLGAGTHMFNNFIQDIHVYPIGTQKITFDAKTGNADAEYETIPVEVGENGGQKAWVSISVNYHLNPTDIVKLHKQGIGHTYESVVLKREIVDTVNEIARPYKSALELYSGTGFVKFKNQVDDALKNNSVLKDRGIDVENTIIYGVHLDPAYENEIAQKQIAQQQVLRKQEETKAAEQEAKRIFAMSQAQVEQVRQEAEARKIQMVTAAEANARKTVLDAEAERDSNLARSAGELAIGKARAEVAQLNRDAQYAGESGQRKAQVEIETQRAMIVAGLFKDVKILPSELVSIGASVLGVDSQGN